MATDFSVKRLENGYLVCIDGKHYFHPELEVVAKSLIEAMTQ